MNRKYVLASAAAAAFSTLALAQAGAGGGATGGTSGQTGAAPAARINTADGVVAPGQTGVQGRTDIEVPWQDGTGVAAGPAVPPRVGGPAVDVRPPQQRQTVGMTPPVTTPPSSQLPPPGTVTPRVDVTPGTGGVTSTTAGTASTAAPTTQPSANAAAPSGAPIVGAPSGFFQGNSPNTSVTGAFGSSDPNINATANQPVNSGIDASAVDVTQRTQSLSQQTLNAQPAGSTLQPTTQPVREQPLQQQNRPSIPMPQGNTGGAGGMNTPPAR